MNSTTLEKIRSLASGLLPEVIDLRRAFHREPELSFHEVKTSEKIKAFLSDNGIPFSTGWAEHGIVAEIKGKESGPVVMLRADMDALPIQELNDVPYVSSAEGCMHACGHDVHMASLMGCGKILYQLRDEFKGTIKLLFQPGEEKLPGGASLLIREGLLEREKPEYMFALHVFPSLPAGHLGFHAGQYMASADELYITIIGKGGHAAMPHQCTDPIPITARIITALQELVSRQVDPLLPAVLTIGKVYSHGGATNIIPERVSLEGTLRTMDETWRVEAHEKIRTTVLDICHASHAAADVRIEVGYPFLYNDESLTAHAMQLSREYVGEDKTHAIPRRMTSEDFAFFSQRLPVTFYRLGTGGSPDTSHPVHSGHFNINENALETGMGFMACLAMSKAGLI